MKSEFGHTSVLATEVYGQLSVSLTASKSQDPVLMVDATVGLGGHSEYFLSRLPGIFLLAIDRDERALAQSTNRLAPYGERVFFYHGRFDEISEAYAQSPWGGEVPVMAILADFGLSSLQIDDQSRGFTYAHDAYLDMRMDKNLERSAVDILADYSAADLIHILKVYGQERFASAIVKRVIQQRSICPIERSSQLVQIIYDSIPERARRTGGHPAKRTFQALRIAVNDELGAIENFLPSSFELLAIGGRIVCLSFHSLEDIMVKKFFATVTTSHTPRGLPVELPGLGPKAQKLFSGAYQASEAEISVNPRAASVRMRGIEKLV